MIAHIFNFGMMFLKAWVLRYALIAFLPLLLPVIGIPAASVIPISYGLCVVIMMIYEFMRGMPDLVPTMAALRTLDVVNSDGTANREIAGSFQFVLSFIALAHTLTAWFLFWILKLILI